MRVAGCGVTFVLVNLRARPKLDAVLAVVGLAVGLWWGLFAVGFEVGFTVELAVGLGAGLAVGLAVGVAVGGGGCRCPQWRAFGCTVGRQRAG